MSFISAFDVMGPNMIGPSSSHTAGAARISYLAHKMIEGPLKRLILFCMVLLPKPIADMVQTALYLEESWDFLRMICVSETHLILPMKRSGVFIYS